MRDKLKNIEDKGYDWKNKGQGVNLKRKIRDTLGKNKELGINLVKNKG